MTTIRITYFDFHGGRAEPARIALTMGGIPFEDERVSFQQFGERRDGYRFRCLPVAEIDGQVITQSNAINRYVGKLTGLYPEDRVQAMWCDEAMEAVEDILYHLVSTFGLEGDALRDARKELVDGWLPIFIRGIGQLVERGGDYIAGNRLTMADLKVFLFTRHLRSGNLDHVPADLVDRLAPALVTHQQRIEADPGVRAYYEQFGQ